MEYKELMKEVLRENQLVLESIDDDLLNEFVSMICSADKIVGYSAGRMGFGLKAFLMRLNHLGIPAYWIGDNYVPPMAKNDLFICCSNSGTTKSVANIMDIFINKAGGKVVAFVGNKESYMGKMASLTIPFKTCNGGLNSADNDSKINSIQPMTTLTEQAMFLMFDIVAKMIIEKKAIDLNETKTFHSNIE